MLTVTCQSCQKQYRVADELSGKRVRCKQCGAAMTVPAVDPNEPIPVAPLVPPPLPPPVPAFRQAVFTPPKPSKHLRLSPHVSWAGSALLLLSIPLMAFALMKVSAVRNAAANPQTLTAKQLATGGFGDNPNVTVTDLKVMQKYVYIKPPGGVGDWQAVYVPLVPADLPPRVRSRRMNLPSNFALPEDVPSEKIRIVMKTADIKNEGQFVPHLNRPSFTGLVEVDGGGIESAATPHLLNEYPNLNTSTVYVLQEGRTQSPVGWAALAALGAIMVLVGLLLFTVRFA